MHTLLMQGIPGITQDVSPGHCPSVFVLGYQQSCLLTLIVHGNALNGNIVGGPVVCEQGNVNQCYQPNPLHRLAITRGPAAAYTLGGVVFGLSGRIVLQDNGGDNLTINSNGSFTFTTPVAQGAPYNVTVATQPVGQTCTVTNGSGTMGGANVTNVSVNCVTNTTTLSTSISQLALSVTGLTEYGVSGNPASGLARLITISNTGSNTALNLAVNTPTWPAGTSSTTTCTNTLPAGSSCTITIIPGATATSDGTNPCSSGTAPIPGAIQISADNAATVLTHVVILNYGCIYQGGYVFALDDTTPDTGSVGGKVVTTADQAAAYPNGIIWSSNGNGGSSADVAFDSIYGISQLSTPSSPNPSSGQVAGQTACYGATDGVCDTNNIYVYYQNNATNAPINLSYYAAGLCKQMIANYSDWYLPAICEMGYRINNGCGTSSVPTLQNIQSSLIDRSGFSAPAGRYWSSTEISTPQQNYGAWYQLFASSGSSQVPDFKDGPFGVRCSRALTP
ncbi:hypothetical protein ACNVED_16590 (plasmid) [Legionella sp. D16C41]|uniref:hypothetical protein n=1 Tax=Legionella sp. D16C41 TaxID=3402688 RepID=UPI003AF6D3DD